jgi:hypothetical protein
MEEKGIGKDLKPVGGDIGSTAEREGGGKRTT